MKSRPRALITEMIQERESMRGDECSGVSVVRGEWRWQAGKMTSSEIRIDVMSNFKLYGYFSKADHQLGESCL